MAERRSYTRLWVLLGLIVAGIAAYPWLSPMIGVADTCKATGMPARSPTIRNVALDLCVNSSVWTWIPTDPDDKQSYSDGPDKIYLDTFGQAEVYSPERLRQAILDYSEKFATNNEDFEITGETTTMLGGREWNVLSFETQTGSYIVYSYAAEGFGSAEIYFQSFKGRVARRDEVAGPILASIAFRPATAGSSAKPG